MTVSLPTRKIVFGLLAMLLSGTAQAEIPAAYSPLLAQSQFSQATVAKLVEAIKGNAGGMLTPLNAGLSVNEAIAANPGISMDMVTAALSQLHLSGPTLAEAAKAVGMSFGVSVSGVLSSMIIGTYMNGGKGAARTQMAQLATVFSDDAINEFLERETFSQLMDARDLNEIRSEAGDVSVYSG